MYHHENWIPVIRPLVLDILGTRVGNEKIWLKTMNQKEKELWDGMSLLEKAVYTRKADAINSGQLAQEAKVE